MPKLYSRLLFLLLGCLTTNFVSGQNIIRISQGNATACAATFYDSGGPNGPHTSSGTFQEITICSDMPGTSLSQIRISFQTFNIDGTMTIFDGPNTMAPLYATIDSDIPDDRFSNGRFVVQARAANTSGCLTLRFESRGDSDGWEGFISCEKRCQEIIAELSSTTPAAQPDPSGYVDICPGDEVTFVARGIYSEANIPGAYPQQDGLSTFTWNFQDGTVLSGQGLTSVSHVFEDPGGYVVQLIIEDEEQCTNLNRISQRVRVAPPPVFTPPTNLPESICVGEEITLTVGREESAFDVNFDPTPVEFSFNTSQTFSELTELPDNTVDEFNSPLNFSNFAPGQVLGQASDLVRICASMEHSYLGDLDIWITCPDGSRVDLHRFATDDVQRQLLGQGNTDTNTPDPPGLYCWTTSAPRTMAQHVTQFNIGDNVTMPEIDYAPEESLDDFVGCPLNGEWTMNIKDNLSQDNGYIYEWSIEFAASLYPDQETFLVPVNDFRFENFNNFSFYGIDSAIFNAPNPGPNNIRIVSIDDYGCVYDTNVVIEVLPPYAAECFDCGPLLSRTQLDTSICQGENFQPNLTGGIETDTLITFESYALAPFGNALYRNGATPFENIITIADFIPARLSDLDADLESICVSLDNNGDLDDVTIQVMSPNGRTLTLLQTFGGNGEDLMQTCFSPTATNTLGSGTAPYTGTFRPSQDNWATFNNVRINGDWTLVAFDRQGNDLGTLISWSITLRYDRDFSYTWTPDDGSFSCTNCPNPTITPVAAGTYTLNVMTAAGCTEQATVNVTFNVLDITVTETLTNPTCPGTPTGAIDQTVTGTDPSYNYAWSDGGPATQDRTGLPAGMYSVTISDANGCQEVHEYELTERPALVATLDEVINASCFGASNGEIRVTTTGGTSPYTFLWDDPNAQNDEDAGALTEGSYNLLVTDAVGCSIRLSATVGQPDQLAVTFRTGVISCRGGNDGYAVAVPTGGNGDYNYQWQTGSDQDSIFGLSAGTYEVVVTDQFNCMTTATVSLVEPAATLTATIVQDERGCFGASANRATVTAMGGSGGFTFLWSNGEVTATAIALPAGPNTVTVSDATGCMESFPITIDELPELTVNVIATVPSCNNRTDGRLGAIPTGGAGTGATDYTYVWSTGGTDVAIINLPGNINYQVTVTGPRGCSGVGERFLVSPPPITFSVDETPVACFGESNGGLSIVNISGPNPGNFDLQWSPEANSLTTPTVSGLPAGSSYGLRITDVDGCTIDSLLTISEPPAISSNINQTDVSCFGETDGRISVTATGGVGNFRYLWNTGSTQNQIAALPASTYMLTLSDGNGCEDISTVEIVQPDAISITADGVAAICEGEATGTVVVTGGGGRPPYLFGLEGQGFTRNPTFIGLREGQYVALVRDSSGCQISTNVSVADGPEFSLLLPDDQDIIFGDSLTLVPEITGGIDTIIYRWIGSYGGTLSCTDCPEPVAKPEYEIDYTLLVSDGNGCSDEQRLRVSVAKIREVQVPTGFTPNNDLMNDRLIVHGRPGTLIRSFTVFDQWANVLYEASDFDVNDIDSGWDGTVGNQPVNAGVYLYKLVVEYDDGSSETLAGETTLIR